LVDAEVVASRLKCTSSFCGEPGLLLAGLGQDATAFDREAGWAGLDHHKHPVRGDVGDPGHGDRYFGCETGCFGFRATGPHPAAD
jgi:hypothetical protein